MVCTLQCLALRKNSTEGLCSRSQTRSSKGLSCPASAWFILTLVSQFSPSHLTYFFIFVLKDILPPRLFFCQTASCLYPDQGAAKNTISSSDLSFRLSWLFLPQIACEPSSHTSLVCLFGSSTRLSSWRGMNDSLLTFLSLALDSEHGTE